MFCEPGDAHTIGEDTHCADCSLIRGSEQRRKDPGHDYQIRDKSIDNLHQEGWDEPITKEFDAGTQWEVFRCGVTSDALFKPCTVCQRGEYEETPCQQTADTVCPVCNLNPLGVPQTERLAKEI